MRTNKRLTIIILTLVLLWAAANTGYAETYNEVLSAPQVTNGDNKELGTLRLTEIIDSQKPVQEGDQVRISLPVGVSYMRAPTADSYRNYVAWPASINGKTNKITDGNQPGVQFLEGDNQSLTVKIENLDQTKDTAVLEFIFNVEDYSKVRVSRLLKWGGPNVTEPKQTISRLEFLLKLHDVTASFEDCPVDIRGSAPVSLLDKFKDKDIIPAAEAPKIAAIIDAGIISGYPDGELKLSEPLTRVEAAVIIGGFLPALTEHPQISQNDIPSWAFDRTARAIANNFIEIYPGGLFKPYSQLTRGDAVIMLEKLFYTYNRK